jgi:hypothetical protein
MPLWRRADEAIRQAQTELAHVNRVTTMEQLAADWSRYPTTGVAGCCARTARGHAAAAPPRSVMNSRRFTFASRSQNLGAG